MSCGPIKYLRPKSRLERNTPSIELSGRLAQIKRHGSCVGWAGLYIQLSLIFKNLTDRMKLDVQRTLVAVSSGCWYASAQIWLAVHLITLQVPVPTPVPLGLILTLSLAKGVPVTLEPAPSRLLRSQNNVGPVTQYSNCKIWPKFESLASLMLVPCPLLIQGMVSPFWPGLRVHGSAPVVPWQIPFGPLSQPPALDW